ncbi:MAG: hypothetical protein [Podoviridae sp. ctpVR23]|nr:MAG: hypothetical protein [Podoviridae sp. ctpVR23]
MAKANIADQMFGQSELKLEYEAVRIVRSYNSVKYVFKDNSNIVIKDGRQVKGSNNG